VPPEALRAAELCKSDLVSEMIKDGKEFTRLEGTIGAHYARRAGESEAVARAIERHHLPRGASDDLPGDRVSSLLSIADRLDTLAGCWLAGFVPTGAKDPYALRRHALALLRIVIGLGARVSLRALLEAALAGFGDRADEVARRGAAVELGEFVRTRLEGHLESLGCPLEAVRAALPAHGDDPVAALAWARELAEFRGRPDFGQLATGFKRCKNILEGRTLTGTALETSPDRWRRGGETADGKPLSDLPDATEQELRRQVAMAMPGLEAAASSGDLTTILKTLSGFGPAIDRFFDAVRVNVEDTELRELRHGFLREIHGLFARYAEFGEMAPLEG
jgi:glycyl-tRNA synthetase beta chain